MGRVSCSATQCSAAQPSESDPRACQCVAVCGGVYASTAEEPAAGSRAAESATSAEGAGAAAASSGLSAAAAASASAAAAAGGSQKWRRARHVLMERRKAPLDTGARMSGV